MKIEVQNLGVINYANINTKKLTVICGKNNSGKTYITYAIYGFLKFWEDEYTIDMSKEIIKELKESGVVTVNLLEYVNKSEDIVRKACEIYSKEIYTVFSAQQELFKDTKFAVTLEKKDIVILEGEYENGIKAANSKTSESLTVKKGSNSNELIITLYKTDNLNDIPDFIIGSIFSMAIKHTVFSNCFNNVFIASAERTGAAIFREELNFARNKMLEKFIKKDAELHPFELLKKDQLDYAKPIYDNVEFARKLALISTEESFIKKNHPEILDRFSDILGGQYLVIKKSDVYFSPNNANIKLSLDESSSAVRSMLDLGFYLKHIAKYGDMIMIDEPELNLHPENQRKVARLIGAIVNSGISVLVTTHSDYILREFSSLVMLSSEDKRIVDIREREGYLKAEVIPVENICVCIAEKAKIKKPGASRASNIQTLVSVEIDLLNGIKKSCFDEVIQAMNNIQDEIIFGG